LLVLEVVVVEVVVVYSLLSVAQLMLLKEIQIRGVAVAVPRVALQQVRVVLE
jgi:hypothetical protein